MTKSVVHKRGTMKLMMKYDNLLVRIFLFTMMKKNCCTKTKKRFNCAIVLVDVSPGNSISMLKR